MGNTVTPILGACLAWLLAATVAQAGPWPRDARHSFLALTKEHDRAGNSYAGFYAEYGLAHRRTLGLEISHTDVGETSAMVWYQKSLDGGQGPNKLAYSTGFGVIRRDGHFLPSGQITLMWGRGFSNLWNGGWLTAEVRLKVAGDTEKVTVQEGLTRVKYAYLTPEVVTKIDLTVGIRPTKSWALVNQLRLESRKNSDFSAKIASSAVYDLTGPARLEIGLVAPQTGPSEAAIKVGTWLEF